MSYFPVSFPVYPPLMLLLLVAVVPESSTHLSGILGSLLFKFVVEVYVDVLLDFVEAL